MAHANEHLLTAIDVGSAKTCALVAEITDAGVRYRGHGIADSLGSRKGTIVDLEKAVASIQRAVEEAENGIAAPIWYVSPQQINFQAPFEIATDAQVAVTLASSQTNESDSRTL